MAVGGGGGRWAVRDQHTKVTKVYTTSTVVRIPETPNRDGTLTESLRKKTPSIGGKDYPTGVKPEGE